LITISARPGAGPDKDVAMKTKLKLLIPALAVLLILPLTACEKEGPAEKAGKKLDRVLDSAKEKINDATH
jgi:hypothetical protein